MVMGICNPNPTDHQCVPAEQQGCSKFHVKQSHWQWQQSAFRTEHTIQAAKLTQKAEKNKEVNLC